MQQLNRKTANKTAIAPERIMQFGGGNFLRAFSDWMFDVLNKETDFEGSIVIIKPTQRGDYDELKQQDGLFHVALDGIRKGELVSTVTLVESVSRVIQPYTQWDDYLKLAESPDLRFIISNTTESGIRFSETDQLNDNPPHEFPAKVTVWLHHRFQYFKGDHSKGCILMPCELIENNGEALKKAIIQYAHHFNLSSDFVAWIENSNYFCNTLVDRIVSGYPTDRADEILKQIGYNDPLLVAGEDYHSFVVQGPAIVQKELPFSQTNLNVQFVNDISAYCEMKVRILNGAHTSLVPVAYLAGLRTVKESMENPNILQFVNEVLAEEITKTLQNFPEEELDYFVNAVLDRFKNPTLKHFLISISLNSTSKFMARLYPALKEYTESQGQLPKRIVFSLSCLIRFYKGEYNNEIIPINDATETLDFFKMIWSQKDAGTIGYTELVQKVIGNVAIWGENLTTIPNLVETVASNLEALEKNGIEASIKNLVS
ncbi:altronate oxidoreductase [Flavobacterium faecale]|uniref:Altronate oxidoreductase n=1 Tax=Flavobacterium faecale TaxID=1355330 RepID=A0A2S1LIV9_9FLAO|nr:tagaturonate reductase [Flavobacterium faecale]AWG23669.1 altronate oxidoreductase [Flavobacterium faecale]